MNKLSAEVQRSHLKRINSGFYVLYMSGKGIDVGYRGYSNDTSPVLYTAEGIDLDTPNYNGLNLFHDNDSLDYVFNSHTLEHISDYKSTIKEWFRVLKPGGHLIIIVPHQFLYEKKATLPSNFNEDHKRFYTASSLLKEVEDSLEPNTYRISHLRDNDDGFNYSLGPEKHSDGCYEIELVVKKIKKPSWEIK